MLQGLLWITLVHIMMVFLLSRVFGIVGAAVITIAVTAVVQIETAFIKYFFNFNLQRLL